MKNFRKENAAPGQVQEKGETVQKGCNPSIKEKCVNFNFSYIHPVLFNAVIMKKKLQVKKKLVKRY